MMLDYISYQKVPAAKVMLELSPTKTVIADILGVSASKVGAFNASYEVKGQGPLPKVASILLLPIKGAKNIALKLPIRSVEALITPDQAWLAVCDGPAVTEFNVRLAKISCDECRKPFDLEFIEFSESTQQDALAGMRLSGWQASEQKQVCPSCVSKKVSRTQKAKQIKEGQ